MEHNATTIPGHLEPNGYQQINSLAAATALTAPDKTVLAVIQPTAQNVRWRDDGTDPTATIGMRLVANDMYFYAGNMVNGETPAKNIKFIEEAGGAVLNITYYRNRG